MEINIIKEDDIYDTFFCYIPNFIDDNNIMLWLNSMSNFMPSNNYNDKIGRYQKWYQEDKCYFCDQWVKKYRKWESFDYDEKLRILQEKVQSKINNIQLNQYGINNPIINSCLINKYRTGQDYITAHRDTHRSFGEYPTIVGLSIGSERHLVLKRTQNYSPDKDSDFSFKLESGSLFIMGGCSQKYFTHEIPQSNTTDIRYSLTFREFVKN